MFDRLRNQDIFELVLKRIYGTPNIALESKNAAAVLKAGDYFGIVSMVHSALLSVGSSDISEDIKPLLTNALTHDKGDFSNQCILDCLEKIIMNSSQYLQKHGRDPELKTINNALKGTKWNEILYVTRYEYVKALLLCMWLTKMSKQILKGDDKIAENVFLKLLNEKIDFGQISGEVSFSTDTIKHLVSFRDVNGYPFINYKVLTASFVITKRDRVEFTS
ncbi:unnamed protein product [Ambrosiozyma monospora]|uniref:Unnamed protein product n=1 Tax=Ambrosiozyma monospora TaxID=43982 RepID=A0ACB5T6L0_AMBMO|nr:unnamed protein product [Ambrosiozyma monospora]